LSSRLARKQEQAEDAGVLYVVAMRGRPANIFRVGVELGGVSAIRDAQQKQGFRVIKIFKLEAGYDWKSVLMTHAQPWWENDAEYVVNNINELLFDLASDLLPAG